AHWTRSSLGSRRVRRSTPRRNCWLRPGASRSPPASRPEGVMLGQMFPRERDSVIRDLAFYLFSAFVAWLAGLASSTPPDHEWAHLALFGYAVGALISAALRVAGLVTLRARAAVAVGVFSLVGLLPLAVDLTRTTPTGDVRNLKSDVAVIALGARAMGEGRDPYTALFSG